MSKSRNAIFKESIVKLTGNDSICLASLHIAPQGMSHKARDAMRLARVECLSVTQAAKASD